jgi:hypothetical protein
VIFIQGGETFTFIPESVTLGGTFMSMATQGLSYFKKRNRRGIWQHEHTNQSNFCHIKNTKWFSLISYLIHYQLIQVIEGQGLVGRCTSMVDFMVEELRLCRAIVNDESVYTHAKTLAESMLYLYVVTFINKFMFCFLSNYIYWFTIKKIKHGVWVIKYQKCIFYIIFLYATDFSIISILARYPRVAAD